MSKMKTQGIIPILFWMAALFGGGCSSRQPAQPVEVHPIEGHPDDTADYVAPIPRPHPADIWDDYDYHLERQLSSGKRWRMHGRGVAE